MGLIEKSYRPGLPATQGHFPGNPIVPGAWLLADALASIATELGWDAARSGACVVKSAKFLAPCRPGQALRISYTENAGLLNIECTVGDTTVLSARITCPLSPAIPKA